MKTYLKFTTDGGRFLSGRTLKSIGRQNLPPCTIIGLCPNGNRHHFELTYRFKGNPKSKTAKPLPHWKLVSITADGQPQLLKHKTKADWKSLFLQTYKSLSNRIQQRLKELAILQASLKEAEEIGSSSSVKELNETIKRLDNPTFRDVYQSFLEFESNYKSALKNGININYRSYYEYLNTF